MADEAKRNCPACGAGTGFCEPRLLPGFLACPACGMLFAAQRDAGKERATVKEYYSRHDPHEKVARAKGGVFVRGLAALERGRGPGRVLDVGCGYGDFLALAASRGWEPTGLEVAPAAAAAAKKRLGEDRVLLSDLAHADLAPESFDAITLWDVLMYSMDPATDLARCKSLLAPGGRVLLRTRNPSFQRTLLAAWLPFAPLYARAGVLPPTVFHPLMFTPRALRSLLSRAGFGSIRMRNSPLTLGNPYGGMAGALAAFPAKAAVSALARATEALTFGRVLAGPSLLATAQKGEG
ncbi:MAG: methyltransferase domain-containing protein [Deltaproteobacteria bacterium]|nr:methyltransferase domain-containing protein [Deltaproteobacteria bacterium]